MKPTSAAKRGARKNAKAHQSARTAGVGSSPGVMICSAKCAQSEECPDFPAEAGSRCPTELSLFRDLTAELLGYFEQRAIPVSVFVRRTIEEIAVTSLQIDRVHRYLAREGVVRMTKNGEGEKVDLQPAFIQLERAYTRRRKNFQDLLLTLESQVKLGEISVGRPAGGHADLLAPLMQKAAGAIRDAVEAKNTATETRRTRR